MSSLLDHTAAVSVLALALSALASLAAPTPASPDVPSTPAHPNRVVALGLPADEMALALAPSRVVAVDRFADDALASNVTREAQLVRARVPVRTESIAALAPDLVLVPAWASPDLDTSLHRLGIATLRTSTPHDVDGVRATIRTVARALDARDIGEQLVRDMDASLARTRTRCAGGLRPSVLLDAGSGVSPGAHTLLAELVNIAGGELLLARSGEGLVPLSLERELSLDPDVLLVDAYRADARARSILASDRGTLGLDPRTRTLRAVREQRAHALPARVLLTTTHHIASAADALCTALRSEGTR